MRSFSQTDLTHRAPLRHRPASLRRGFTVVELMIVVGIIALLLGITFPVVNRVREQVKRAQCQAQMKQIGVALIEYTNANQGYFPAAASVGDGHKYEDWIYWQTGQDITKSRIAPYLTGGKDVLEKVMRCPSDPNFANRNYKYSYAMNNKMASTLASPIVRRRDVLRASDKILLVEEGETTIDDGRWVWPGNALATWHDRAGVQNKDAGYGSVFFLGGNAGYVTRDQSDDPKYCDPKTP